MDVLLLFQSLMAVLWMLGVVMIYPYRRLILEGYVVKDTV